MILALLKAGFSYENIIDMPEETAVGFLETYVELKNKSKIYKVKKERL